MATLTIRNLPEATRQALRVRAAEHGRSMEAEVRELILTALTEPEPSPTSPVDITWVDGFVELGSAFREAAAEIPDRSREAVRFVDLADT